MRARTRILASLLVVLLAACASLTRQDPLKIDVAGIEPLASEGMELRLAVKIRVQNPNDHAVDYTGTALDLDLNGRSLASGVSDQAGTVPRYGEAVITVPVTISAFDMARQVMGAMNAANQKEMPYSVRGKLEGGGGARRFSDEGTFDLSGSASKP
jgi:LEA14-like dessication related protein